MKFDFYDGYVLIIIVLYGNSDLQNLICSTCITEKSKPSIPSIPDWFDSQNEVIETRDLRIETGLRCQTKTYSVCLAHVQSKSIINST